MFLNEAYWDISFYRGLCKLIIALIQIDRVLGIVMIIFTLMLPFPLALIPQSLVFFQVA